MKSKTFFSKRLVSYITWTVVGFVAGAVTLLYTQGCAGPPRKAWHKVNLTQEFIAEKADEVHSFDDYRQLEERLFEQLEEKVYSQTPTGPDYALVRYSAGSAADPQILQPNWNRSFEFSAADPVGAVLLLHGMSDSPYSLRVLAQTLKAHN
jgi:hypothetical protein